MAAWAGADLGEPGLVMPRQPGMDGGGGSQPQSRWLIHTETWAGSRARDTTPARSSRTESRFTASFRRVANAATVWSASYRARLNRRSTAFWTRRRSGLNSAAAARVEAATATGVWTRNTWVVSSTSPAYTPTSSPVTIAYARVREMIRSISYSRYLRTAVAMAVHRHKNATLCSTFTTAESTQIDTTNTTTSNSAAVAHHFSCNRSSPEDFANLTTSADTLTSSPALIRKAA